MIKLCIGPEADTVSWRSIGFALARELSKYFNIGVFRDRIPLGDVAITLQRPHDTIEFSGKLIYFPNDQYEKTADIRADNDFLAKCDAIGCHSECLIPYFTPFCRNVYFIEQHNRYTLPQINTFKCSGYILWIGSSNELPYLLKWLYHNPIDRDIRILTNINDIKARDVNREISSKLGIDVQWSTSSVNGHPVFEWSERTQYNMMREAKAAIGVSAGAWVGRFDWHAYMKSPVLAQQFISSGIPFAMNDDTYTFDYFKRRGFVIASPNELSNWLSIAYWEKTVRHAVELRSTLSLSAIGERVRDMVLSVMNT